METFETLSEAIAALRKDGYTEDFNLKENCIDCQQGKHRLSPHQFHIDKFFRFEGMTNPDDQTILYAISAPELGLKGTLVNAYGLYADAIANEMVQKLSVG